MTDNRMDVDSFEKTHENSFSSREKHLTQSLYSELKHLRKKPKTHDLQHHLPQSQNCHNLLDKSPIVKVLNKYFIINPYNLNSTSNLPST